MVTVKNIVKDKCKNLLFQQCKHMGPLEEDP